MHTHIVVVLVVCCEMFVLHALHMHLEVELESACLSGQVRPSLYSFDSTQPLSCLGSSVVRTSA